MPGFPLYLWSGQHQFAARWCQIDPVEPLAKYFELAGGDTCQYSQHGRHMSRDFAAPITETRHRIAGEALIVVMRQRMSRRRLGCCQRCVAGPACPCCNIGPAWAGLLANSRRSTSGGSSSRSSSSARHRASALRQKRVGADRFFCQIATQRLMRVAGGFITARMQLEPACCCSPSVPRP